MNLERLPKSRSQTKLTFTKEQVTLAEAQALERLRTKIEIKGFRVGHAPLESVRERVKPEHLLEEVVHTLLQDTVPALMKEHNLHPVLPPKIEIKQREPLQLSITFIEKPTATIKSSKLAIAKKDTAPKETDVQKVVDSVLSEHRTAQPVDRAAKKDDQVTIDFHATDGAGQEIAGLRASEYKVLIGSAHLLPGFEDQLIGLKKGEEKSFTLTLPEKFQVESLRGKPATFHVTVKTVEETHLPAFDDAFAKQKLQSDSAEVFKATVRDSLKKQEEQFERMRRENELLAAIRTHTHADIADELLEEEMRSIVHEWTERVKKEQINPEDALKKEGKTVQQKQEEWKKQAEDRWKLRLGISALIEEKKITTTPEELQTAFDDFLSRLPVAEKDHARKEWESHGTLYEELRWRAMVEKTIEDLLV